MFDLLGFDLLVDLYSGYSGWLFVLNCLCFIGCLVGCVVGFVSFVIGLFSYWFLFSCVAGCVIRCTWLIVYLFNFVCCLCVFYY